VTRIRRSGARSRDAQGTPQTRFLRQGSLTLDRPGITLAVEALLA
jgi:hypothetical protein